MHATDSPAAVCIVPTQLLAAVVLHCSKPSRFTTGETGRSVAAWEHLLWRLLVESYVVQVRLVLASSAAALFVSTAPHLTQWMHASALRTTHRLS
jgi:hypothetical protein